MYSGTVPGESVIQIWWGGGAFCCMKNAGYLEPTFVPLLFKGRYLVVRGLTDIPWSIMVRRSTHRDGVRCVLQGDRRETGENQVVLHTPHTAHHNHYAMLLSICYLFTCAA